MDYSLAPEYPFPRAIEECYYAYAWILKNANKLGWTGKTLLLVGDSTGGDLITVVTMQSSVSTRHFSSAIGTTIDFVSSLCDLRLFILILVFRHRV